MAGPGGLLSPSYKEEEGVAVQIRETQEEESFQSCDFKGTENASIRQAPGISSCLGARGPSRGARVV